MATYIVILLILRSGARAPDKIDTELAQSNQQNIHVSQLSVYYIISLIEGASVCIETRRLSIISYKTQ